MRRRPAHALGVQPDGPTPPPLRMSNTDPPRVRDVAVRGPAARDPARRGVPGPELDPRVARTTRALGRALVALLEERAFNAITVQDILDRAGVGRTAFYAHYRNKHDVLYSSYEGVFAWLEPLVERPSPSGPPGVGRGRLFPVAEFLAHVGDVAALVQAFRRDGLLDDMWALLGGHAARLIERRLDCWAGAASAPDPLSRSLLAHMLAGALVESVRWWLDHPGVATPAAVDTAFHELARGVLRRPRP